MEQTHNNSERIGMDVESFQRDVQNHLHYTLAKDQYSATDWDRYHSLVYAVMDRLNHRRIATQQHYYEVDAKRVYYLSMEYLLGRMLDDALINLGLLDIAREALANMNLDYDALRESEWDAGLGNGGLGRLAACFLDSMASLHIPGYGYGIRYDFGIFYQKIVDGYQIESPNLWQEYGTPWDIIRPKVNYPVQFYGEVAAYTDEDGHLRYHWINADTVIAQAYDFPVPGYKNDVVNNLRLWKAESSKHIDLHVFNQGDYINAIRDVELQENISRVLYPNDKVFVGQELRLKQEYFLVAATLRDIIRRFKKIHEDWRLFPEKVAIQCNDTHPNLAIPELMRILVDEEHLGWEQSWDITVKTIAYTNHTLLPEALEKWPIHLLRTLLPRHLQIIYEINNRFLNKVRTDLGEDINRIRRMSIISEGEQPSVQMATLGIVGSHKINGVSEMHSTLLKETLFHDYYELWPERFTNQTNGITPRRWLKQCNPLLADAITKRIGEGWITHLDELRKIDPLADDAAFREEFAGIKYKNKVRLAGYVGIETGETIDPDSIFDIQIKRIHEYKRQLLAALHAVTLYNQIRENPQADITPRTIFFAGKAAPGYAMAKLHIKLINNIAGKINNDPQVNQKLKVFFLHNYSVTLAERMIPAANLSEQISTAGMEASGTGNMKLALNGALTIGTLDGANVEIMNEVGEENIFIFGRTVADIDRMRREGYNSYQYYEEIEPLKQALDQIQSGFFSPNEPDLFQPIIHALLNENDYFMVLADYEDYLNKQREVEAVYNNPDEWWKRAIHNTARMGRFSSDRTILGYANEIWGVKPLMEEPASK